MLDSKISLQELQQEMAQKADVQDVSNAMTEVIVTTDCRKEVESLRQQLTQYKQEIDMEQNQHVKQMFEGFGQETKNLLRQIQASEDQAQALTKRCDDLKKDTNKKTMAVLKEFEKL